MRSGSCNTLLFLKKQAALMLTKFLVWSTKKEDVHIENRKPGMMDPSQGERKTWGEGGAHLKF